MKDGQIPDFVKPCLWSFDLNALNLEDDKQSIIFSVLNNGSEKACRWIISTYHRDTIKKIIEASIASSWDKKSLKLWSIVFETNPKRSTRAFI
jgi:hypothetical protein